MTSAKALVSYPYALELKDEENAISVLYPSLKVDHYNNHRQHSFHRIAVSIFMHIIMYIWNVSFLAAEQFHVLSFSLILFRTYNTLMFWTLHNLQPWVPPVVKKESITLCL